MYYIIFYNKVKMSLEILNKYKIKAKKSLWQNFLVNNDIVEEIANSINIKWKNIVEVWPGYGALTEKLILRKPKSLNLVELDRDMIDILEKRIKNNDFDLDWINFHINNIDVLKYEPTLYSHPPFEERSSEDLKYTYSVIANIPYYITSPILRHFLYDVENKPENMVILMQKDVWDKILWKGKNKSSVLSLFIDKKAKVWEFIVVWKHNFIPSPKIESSVLIFEMHNEYSEINDDKFLELIKKWFKEPRKMLMKNLVNSWYDKKYIIQSFYDLWIKDTIRWEDLNIYMWCQLYLKINN